MNEPRAYTKSQYSPWPGLEGCHHFPPYIILCAWPQGLHPNVIFSWDSRLFEIGTPTTSSTYFWLKWSRKKRTFQQYLACHMHACMQNDSWFLVVGNQIDILTPNPSFNHNLCCKHLIGSCKPILNICILRVFQWYKEFFNSLNFDPYNRSLKIWKFIGIPTLKVGVHLGVVATI